MAGTVRGGPSTEKAVASPACSAVATSDSSPSRPGAGAVASASSTWRSTLRMVRSSASPCLLAVLMAWRAAAAWSGWLSSTWAAMPACTLIIDMLWATTSCSSRAIRSRSASTRRRASSSQACSARSALAVSSWRWLARTMPTATAAIITAHRTEFGPPSQPKGPPNPAASQVTARLTAPTPAATGHETSEATV